MKMQRVDGYKVFKIKGEFTDLGSARRMLYRYGKQIRKQ